MNGITLSLVSLIFCLVLVTATVQNIMAYLQGVPL